MGIKIIATERSLIKAAEIVEMMHITQKKLLVFV